MPIKQTVPTNSGDYLQFGNATTTVVAQIGGYEDSTGNGHLELYTTASGTSTERMRIDANGNVGIGTSSPSTKLTVAGTVTLTTGGISLSDGNGPYWGSGSEYIAGNSSTHFINFATSSTERMRIDSSGNVLVGVTSSGSYSAGSAIGATGYMSRSGTNGSFSNNRFNIYWNGSAARLWIDTVDQGSIAISSDYRIKKDVQVQTLTALDRIEQLRPVTYTYADNETLNWKADGIVREGFIAHELQEIIPSAVDGEKDAKNQIQSLKLDALCSVMVKAIQEQQELIKQLQADVAALKGTV